MGLLTQESTFFCSKFGFKKQLKKEAVDYGRRKKEMTEDCQSEQQNVKAV
jgi:hypothetical protein